MLMKLDDIAKLLDVGDRADLTEKQRARVQQELHRLILVTAGRKTTPLPRFVWPLWRTPAFRFTARVCLVSRSSSFFLHRASR